MAPTSVRNTVKCSDGGQDPTYQPWDVFAQALFGKGYGLMLSWLAPTIPVYTQNGRERPGIYVGDVGYCVDGSFISIFNCLFPRPGDATVDPLPPHLKDESFELSSRLSLSQTSQGLKPCSYRAEQTTLTELTDGNVRQYTRTVEASVSMGRRAQEDLSAAREDIIQYIRHHFGTWIELTKANGQDAVCFVHGVMSSTYVDNSVSVRSYKSEVRKATRKETHFSPWSLRRDNKDQSPQQDKYAFIHFYMAMAKKKNGGNMLERWTKIIGGTPGTRSEAFNQSPVTQVFENDAQPKGPPKALLWNPVRDVIHYILQNDRVKLAIASDEDVFKLFNGMVPIDVPSALWNMGAVVRVDEHGVGTIDSESSSQVLPSPARKVRIKQNMTQDGSEAVW